VAEPESPPQPADAGTQEGERATQEDRAAAAVGAEKMQEAAEAAAEVAERTGGLGRPGRPVDRRSPFFVGMTGAAGVVITIAVAELVLKARAVLILIGLAMFIAAGLDPVVSWLTRHRVPRWAAVLAVVLGGLGIVGGFLATAIPLIAAQTGALISELPHYAALLHKHNSALGRLSMRFHLEQHLTSLLKTKGTVVVSGVLGAGAVVLSAVSSMTVVAVLSIYLLASFPAVKTFGYRLAPHSRRPRVILMGDEIFTKVGGYMLGNIATSVIAGLATYLWLLAWGVPYPVLLGIFVAILDLVPVIGSTIGGAVVSLVALTVSLPVALATLAFYIGFRLAEDYLLVPRIMGRTVEVPAVVTVVSVLVGAALLGIIGALIAIPAAAAVRLLLQEIAFRKLDRS
jgi:predicted PurR-regulated permease PerM